MNINEPITYSAKRIKNNESDNVIQVPLGKKKKMKYIWISLAIIILLAVIITVVIIVSIPPIPSIPPEETSSPIIEPITKVKEKISPEPGFSFNTKIGQLNTISIIQNYTETIVRNGKKSSYIFYRKNIYHIYVISENEPIGDLKYCYSKLYTCAISIVSECDSHTDQNCIPRTILDLTEESIPTEEKKRILQEVEDIKEYPIPLCLFNITDNNGITSITCPNSMNEGKIKGMILDLYFYRPPGIKRVDKKNNNITIDIQTLDNGNQFVRETNGGKCGENNPISHCTTDMNTTKDSEGNLISYIERATTEVKNNYNNNYTKVKESSLFDITKKNNSLQAELYKKNMEKLLDILNPYMHYYEQVSEEQFMEIYEISVNGKIPLASKKRKLPLAKDGYIKTQNVFEYEGLGEANIFLSMSVDSSINTESFKANSYFQFDEDQQDELVNNFYESVLTEILTKLSTVSKAGNHLADELYQRIKRLFQEITKEIETKISNLNNLMSYENITKVFDTSLKLDDLEKLPKRFVEESKNLYENFNELMRELQNATTKSKFNIINSNIYDFLSESHKLIYKISNNLKELGNSLSSGESQLTQISLYYLKQESSSYMKIVEEAQEILEKYYKNEIELINKNISTIIEDFENNLLLFSKDELNMIKELYQKLENKILNIENIDNKTTQNTIDYLTNSSLMYNDIINKIKDLIDNQLELKDGYFESNTDLKTNNISFSSSLSRAKEIANKIENGELIDEMYNEIMSDFRKNFSEVLLFLSREKEGQFIIEEEALEYSLFKNKENKITSKFNEFSRNAIKIMQNENEEYNKKVNATIFDFFKENEEELNSLITDLYVLFSNESLLEISELFDLGFYDSINNSKTIIKNNEKLAEGYLLDIKKLLDNTSYILELLHSFQNDTEHIPYHLHYWNDKHYDEIKYFNDTIKFKNITKACKTKMNNYLSNIEYTKEYLNNQLDLDLINTYKKPIIKLRQLLQSIINIKLEDKYPDFIQLAFKEHKEIINILFKKLDLYLSDGIYNDKYLEYQKKYKDSELENANNIYNYINNQINYITKKTVEAQPGYDGDYCVRFLRIKSYLCTNTVWHYSNYSDNYCAPVSNYTNNDIHLKAISIKNDEIWLNYKNKFNEFYSSINEKIEKYNSKIKELQSDLEKIENETNSKNIFYNYINSFKEELISILNKYYKDELIKGSYEFYQKNIVTKIDKVLNESFIEWNNLFENLEEELKSNEGNFKSSVYEFLLMALAYQSTITQNISRAYYDSIIIEQKNEFNYTISYYYNYLHRLANLTNNYIISRVYSKQNKYNYMIEEKKEILNQFFLSLMENITLQGEEDLKIERQTKVLGVSESNFYKVNYLLNAHIESIKESLDNIINKLLLITIRPNDQNSRISKIYLEDLESGKEINNLYSITNDNVFIFLDSDKKNFEELIISNNWVFNFDEFYNILGLKLDDLNKSINEEFLEYYNQYTNKIENILNNFLTKEGIINKAVELYEDGIKNIDDNKKNSIINNIDNIADYVVEYLSNETIRLENSVESFNENTNLINETLKDFKNLVLTKLNETLVKIPNEFNEIMKKKFYSDYIVKCLNKFYDDLKKGSSSEELKLLNSSFNFNGIINNILEDLKNDYETITLKQINYKYNRKLKEIYNRIDLNEIENLLSNKIDNKFEKDLLPKIKEKIVKDAGYDAYNINDLKQNEIKQFINKKINDIEISINSTKGENYQIKEIKNWHLSSDFDFTSADYQNIINFDIKDDFMNFYNKKLNEINNDIDSLIEQLIKNNFNSLLGYLIPSFAKEYFDRIIKYNENFKISTLYDNLRFSISETLFLYSTICSELSEIPKDLIIKLYNLNNLEQTVVKKNEEILSKINSTLDEYIIEEKKFILGRYSTFFLNELSLESKLSSDITSRIKARLSDSDTIRNKICKNYFDTYLKEPFIESYNNVMKTKTDEMLRFVNEQKEYLRQLIHTKTIIDSENVLNNINEKLNITKDSIKEYKDHFITLKIDKDIIQFLNNYGKNNVKPLFSQTINIVNNAKLNSKQHILENINKYIEDYELKFNLDKFMDSSNEIFSLIKNNYIKNLTDSISLYGPSNYIENLKQEIINNEGRNLRILEGNETQEDIRYKFREKIPDLSIDFTFQNILETSDIAKSFINNLKEFNTFDERIKEYKKK